jgi:hypothetical protein
MRVIIFGNVGSDAGYWVLDDTGLHHVGGWGYDSFAETHTALALLAKTSQLKSPGLAEAVSQALLPFIEKEIKTHVKEASDGIIVVVNQA